VTVISSFYDYPVWTTPPYLGTFAQDYSFDLNPIQIVFGANTNSVVSILNGALPSGLNFQQIYNSIYIFGSAVETNTTIYSQITFRVVQPNGSIADRTFFLNLTPVARSPSWTNQHTFLGYQSNISIQQYTLQAVSESGNPLLYDLPNYSAYSQINSHTGVFSLNAISFSSNVQVTTTVRATDSVNGTSSNVNVSVDIVTVPGPNWVTPAGSLGIFYSGSFVEFNLLAEDPFDQNVIYQLNEPSQILIGYGQVWDDDYGWDNDNFVHLPLSVSSSGLVYGTLPQVVISTIYTFKVIATSSNKSSTAYFSLTNEPALNNKVFYWLSTSSDLGIWDEGQYISIPIKAVTTRGTTIVYNVTGGLLPPHLMLGTTDGKIIGFIEYTAINKTYYFNVTANDGYQTITQQFNITINKVYGNQYLNIEIPLAGTIKNTWLADTANVRVREPGQIIYDGITNSPNNPTLSIISGLETGFSTPQEIISIISPWFYQLSLQIGAADNTIVQSNGMSVIYRNITDYQSGSNTQVYSNYVKGNEVYPISINHIRNALIETYSWVLSGSGSGFALLPNLNWNTGAIQSVTILDNGFGFLSPPKLIVEGAGTGAELKAVLGLVSLTVPVPGYGWVVGQIISIAGNDAVSPAILSVTSISSVGGLLGLDIINSGNYKHVGSLKNIPISTGTSYAEISPTWGIVDAQIVNGGINYQCGITINVEGGELLPAWQNQYSPVIEVGEIKPTTGQIAVNVLNTEPISLYGTQWQPNYLVLQWQGLTYVGSCIFDEDTTTFDGDTTRFIDTESVYDTVFDEQREVFDNDSTIFDYQDPLMYDLEQVWGGTLIDSGTTVMDLYSTIFDSLRPKTYSNTRLQRWFNTTNKIYSGNNAVT
jgi:hypothetical protein